jgi:hypothetical protein
MWTISTRQGVAAARAITKSQGSKRPLKCSIDTTVQAVDASASDTAAARQ